MIGKTLAHYEITSQLGKGGMGEVFRAKDQKLGRDVAIKVLPQEFARDTDRVARFQREAKLLASLNHPNIAAIYGLEESGGTSFLVLELVEGETLADRIKTGPIPVEESLKLALQIAEALEAAHEKGVIHRDLKPANIKVTPDGKVKVLDFGLAKAFAGEQADLNLSNSPTLSNAATQQGVILGTAAYMSPEQARGKTVDRRADIWAFGVVLYEMLTEKSLFGGDDVSQTLARVLERQPDFSALPPNLHPRIRLLLERCLEKDAKNRYHDIADVRVDIQKALGDPGGVFAQPVITAEPRMRLRQMLPWLAAAVVLGAIIAGLSFWKLMPIAPPKPNAVIRLSHELPKDQQFGDLVDCDLAISPDGRQFVYATSTGLYRRQMDELEARLIAGTGGNCQRPVFSPDGKWVAFSSAPDNRLMKITISGGMPVNLADTVSVGSIEWAADNTLAYGQYGKGIMRISADGGTPEVVVKEEKEVLAHPQILPDGKSVMFCSATSEPSRIFVQSIKSGERKELFKGVAARYLPTGHIVYILPNSNNLYAAPFSLDKLSVTGTALPVLEGVFSSGGILQYAISDSGMLVYILQTAHVSPAQRSLVWVDREGKEEAIPAPANTYSNPKISPDGTRVSLTIESGRSQDIWVWHLVHKMMTRLTSDEIIDTVSLWSPDSKRIAFASNRNGTYGVYWKAANGTGEIENLGTVPGRLIIPNCWSHDGKILFLTEWFSVPPRFDIGVLSLEGDRARKPLIQEKHSEAQPRISPNGRYIAYVSDESGQNQVYVRPFPEIDKGKWQVSPNGGDSPLWSPDGRELFYRSGDATMAVDVETEPAFSFKESRVLFRVPYVSYAARVWGQIENNPWDISPDGKRFLMMKRLQSTGEGAGEENPRKINIVVNWFEELKQRVPVK
jgi:serine/threonine protein kinase/Tol biopolymer transport system component